MSLGATTARMRASAGLLVAVAGMVLVACTLVALVPVYSTAIVDAGLRATIADAPAPDRAMQVSTRLPASDVGALDESIDGALAPRASAFDDVLFVESPAFRAIDPAIAIDPGSGASVITALATFAGDDVFETVDGDLATITDATGPTASPHPAALHVDAAAFLDVTVGDVVTIERSSAAGGAPIDLRVDAVVEAADPADPRWFDEPFGRTGVIASGSFTEVGPFFVAPDDLALIDGDVSVTARFALDDGSIDVADIDALIASVDSAAGELGARLEPHTVRVDTGLDRLLRETDTSVRSTGAVVAAILLQIAAVALYGLGVAASVLVASRQSERVLLNSRGISTRHVARDALAEAALITVPAAVVGPFLAVAAVELVGRWGPLASTGLDLTARPSALSFLLAVAAGAIAVGVITWPAVAATRVPTTGPEAAGREPFLRRTGLDIALFVAAVLGLWQLHRTGSVATTSTPGGRASVDPVLVLAPTLGVAAASLLTVRLLSLAARSLERSGTRSRRLAPALAGWEAARERSRRNRASILLVVAVSVAAFALVHSVSWETSQADQADAAVGADVVVAPDLRPDVPIGPVVLASEYRAVDGVTGIAPISDRAAAITSTLGAVPVVALDATRFAEYSRIRDDVVPHTDAIAAIASPIDLDGIPLPPAGGVIEADITIAATTFDLRSETTVAVDTAVGIALVVTDEFGTLQRLPATAPLDVGADSATEPRAVTFHALPSAASDDRPRTLVEIEVTADVPFVDVDRDPDLDGDGQFDVEIFDIPGTSIDLTIGALRIGDDVIDASSRTWSAVSPTPGRFALTAASAVTSTTDTDGIEIRIETGTTGQRQVSERHRFLTATPIADGDPLPVIDVFATPELVDRLGISVGDDTTARISGLRTRLRIVGETDVVPFAVDEPVALLADHATVAAADYLATATRAQPDRWALEVDRSAGDAVTSTLRATPFASNSVADRWTATEQRTRDPVLVGLTGSLLVAIVAVAIVALVGLVMAAVTGARERRAVHAVLRALGASQRDLRRWLTRETVPLGMVAIAAGAATGVLIAFLVLDSLAGDSDGGPAIPPPALVIPVAALAVLMGTALAAVAVLPIVTSRLLRGVRPADELRIGDQR